MPDMVQTATEPSRAVQRIRDFAALAKVRLNSMVLLSAACGYLLAGGLSPNPIVFMSFLIGLMLVACGAAALNMALENETDARMKRTARRPVASGRITRREAIVFGLLLASVGSVQILIANGICAAAMAFPTSLQAAAAPSSMSPRWWRCAATTRRMSMPPPRAGSSR